MMYIGYEFERTEGDIVRKLVVCKTKDEYHRVRSRIIEAGLTPIEFELTLTSKQVK